MTAQSLRLRARVAVLSRARGVQRWIDQLPPRNSDADIGQLLLQNQYRQLAAAGAAPPITDVLWDRYTTAGEDGVLLYIFALIGFRSRRSVDLGGAGIVASNSMNLILHHDFDALIVDGDERSIDRLSLHFEGHPSTRSRAFRPTCVSTWIDRESVAGIVEDAGFAGEIDLLSIDLDGVDYWILKAVLDVVRPRVIVCEYQDHLGPDRPWTVPYRADFSVDSHPINAGDAYLYCGAGLKAFDNLLAPRGYRFVGAVGSNAFFVLDSEGDGRVPRVDLASAFGSRWTRWGVEHRFPRVANMEWVVV